MDFVEAQAQLQKFQEQWRQGSISAQQFAEAVKRLQVMDSLGRWWQPNPSGQGWLRWDGDQWQPDTPPAQARPPQTVSESAQSFQAGWQHFRSRLMAPQNFLDTSRQVPWSRRPQSWWDALAIAGGAASGYLWFVYSSVRGMPRFKFLGMGRESWLDLLPALILLAIPILLLIFRRTVVKALQSWAASLIDLPLGAKLALGMGGIILVALLQTNNPIFNQREGLDFITPLLMTAIPALLVWFRAETDKILAPCQSWRQKIPELVLVGISLAIPFFTAYIFYNRLGISQYPLLRLNVLVGTLLSYAILRNPTAPGNYHPRLTGITILFFLFLAGCFLCPELVWAHDFLRDPFNLRDGLRTDGIAPVLAGVSTVMVSILVNGVEVAKVLIQDTKPAEEGEEQHKKFVVVVNSVDKTGAISTTLDQVNNDTIFIYAHCEEVGKGRFRAGDPTIQFALTSAADWVVLKDLGTQHGKRCARLTFVANVPAGPPPETAGILVSAGVDDLISTEVDIELKSGGFVLEVF
jgi:hypothetical protein